MATCCPFETYPFVNQLVTTIPYGGQFGNHPHVELSYYIDDTWISGDAAGVFSQIRFIGNPVTSIEVDHGGPAIGIIKIS